MTGHKDVWHGYIDVVLFNPTRGNKKVFFKEKIAVITVFILYRKCKDNSHAPCVVYWIYTHYLLIHKLPIAAILDHFQNYIFETATSGKI